MKITNRKTNETMDLPLSVLRLIVNSEDKLLDILKYIRSALKGEVAVMETANDDMILYISKDGERCNQPIWLYKIVISKKVSTEKLLDLLFCKTTSDKLSKDNLSDTLKFIFGKDIPSFDKCDTPYIANTNFCSTTIYNKGFQTILFMTINDFENMYVISNDLLDEYNNKSTSVKKRDNNPLDYQLNSIYTNTLLLDMILPFIFDFDNKSYKVGITTNKFSSTTIYEGSKLIYKLILMNKGINSYILKNPLPLDKYTMSYINNYGIIEKYRLEKYDIVYYRNLKLSISSNEFAIEYINDGGYHTITKINKANLSDSEISIIVTRVAVNDIIESNIYTLRKVKQLELFSLYNIFRNNETVGSIMISEVSIL